MDSSYDDDGSGDIEFCNARNAYFDKVLDHIEDLAVTPKFMALRKQFFDMYCFYFDDTQEDKMQYTAIFMDYKITFEEYFTKELTKLLEQFDYKLFVLELFFNHAFDNRAILGLLLSLYDFDIFKEMMIDYRRGKEGAGGYFHLAFSAIGMQLPDPSNMPDDSVMSDD